MEINKKLLLLVCLVVKASNSFAMSSEEASKKLFAHFADKNATEKVYVSSLLGLCTETNHLINKHGQTFWHVIAKRSDDKMNNFFAALQENAKVCELIDKKDNFGHTALYYLVSGNYENNHEEVMGLFSNGAMLDLPSARHIVSDSCWKKKYSQQEHQKNIIEVVSQTTSYYCGSFFLGFTMPFFKDSLLKSFAVYATGAVMDWCYVYHTHNRLNDERNRADISTAAFSLGAATRQLFQNFVTVPLPSHLSRVVNSQPWLKPVYAGTAFCLSLLWLKSLSLAR